MLRTLEIHHYGPVDFGNPPLWTDSEAGLYISQCMPLVSGALYNLNFEVRAAQIYVKPIGNAAASFYAAKKSHL